MKGIGKELRNKESDEPSEESASQGGPTVMGSARAEAEKIAEVVSVKQVIGLELSSRSESANLIDMVENEVLATRAKSTR